MPGETPYRPYGAPEGQEPLPTLLVVSIELLSLPAESEDAFVTLLLSVGAAAKRSREEQAQQGEGAGGTEAAAAAAATAVAAQCFMPVNILLECDLHGGGGGGSARGGGRSSGNDKRIILDGHYTFPLAKATATQPRVWTQWVRTNQRKAVVWNGQSTPRGFPTQHRRLFHSAARRP